MTTPEPRYVIGVDLGTTNCALAYIDTASAQPRAQVLEIPQWDSEGATVKASTLPSFYYLPPKAEWKRGQLQWPPATAPATEVAPDYAVGRLARLKSSQVPGRVIHAAKSWLSHAGVDRTARILPWHVGELVGDERRSPVEVSAAYLAHLRQAWDAEIAAGDDAKSFAHQDIVLTVPASFDEVAQRLTLAAAELAGFPTGRIHLLEEPQAAFYHWAATARKQRTKPLKGTVLICDVGGGTTDFSLFEVDASPGMAAQITRTAVSDHLLLGGDNIDLSLAHRLEERLVGAGKRLSSRQWAQLVFATRQLKEKALASDTRVDAGDLHVAIAGEGASLFASAMTASLSQADVTALVIDGFFPRVARDTEPKRARSALMQLGLPYAQDTSLTSHLAAFLALREVDAVLFTGGTLKPQVLQQALLDQITAWQGRRPEALDHGDMDLAVALGAAAFGAALRQPQEQIRGGYPRSLYLIVGDAQESPQLLCIVPQGHDGREALKIAALGLKLRTGQPVRFQMVSSNRRPEDQAGQLIALDAGLFHPLPPLDTRLEASVTGDPRLVDVRLEAVLSATGLFHLYCVQQRPDQSGEQRWQLNFNTRAAATPDDHYAPGGNPTAGITALPALQGAKIQAVQDLIASYYGKKKATSLEIAPAKTMLRDLEGLLDLPREAWPPAFLRSLWPVLEAGLTRRGRSVGHEATWLYLAGFALRPGYGVELDEWRLAELWRAFELGLSFPKEKQVEEQWWLMWRRVAGGLSRAQQERILARIFPALRKNEAASAEVYMLAGSLERIDMGQKIRLGQLLVQQIIGGRQQFINQRMWALARIASRVPLYGGAEAIVRPEVVSSWFQELKALQRQDPAFAKLALFLSQAGRMVLDREFDLSAPVREEFLRQLAVVGATAEQSRVVREFVPVDSAARAQLFGESLPVGLVLA